MRRLKVKDAIRLLTTAGYTFKSQKGSHMKFVDKCGKIMLISNHDGNNELSPGATNSILKAIQSPMR